MAAITVRKLSEQTKQRLRLRAAANGRSMEAEAREILEVALTSNSADLAWTEQLLQVGLEFGGIDLTTLPDEPATAADFD